MKLVRYSKWSQRLLLFFNQWSRKHQTHCLVLKLENLIFLDFFLENTCFLAYFWWINEISNFSKTRPTGAMMTSNTSNERLRCQFSPIIRLWTHPQCSLSSKSIFSNFCQKVYIFVKNDTFFCVFWANFAKSWRFQEITKIVWKVRFWRWGA